MSRCVAVLIGLCVWSSAVLPAAAADRPEPPKVPPAFLKLIQGSADDFIKRFDKNQDGFLTKDELPPRLAERFDTWDKNGDGKLDKKEVEQMLEVLRKRFGADNKDQPAAPVGVPRLVQRWLDQMDTDKDGRISKAEARGPLAQNFDRLDTNKDGFLDKDELRRAAARILANRAGGGGQRPAAQPAGPDFDALDLNADGRLTRDELKGTPYADHFDEIDTNKDGKIDRKEFEAYLKKVAAQKGS